jgi:predicted TIM-barrel fold metal-dependent hydrolase
VGVDTNFEAGNQVVTMGILVISADGHGSPLTQFDFRTGSGETMDYAALPVNADESPFRQYLDPKYRDVYDSWAADALAPRKVIETFVESLTAMTPGSGVDAMSVARREFIRERLGEDRAPAGGWDPASRVKELEADGIVGDVIFPNGAPFQGPHVPVELRLAGTRAYNRWLAEFCAEAPERLAGVALVGLDDIDEAVKDIHAARKAGLRGGILLPHRTEGFPTYNHPRYEPIWQACAELDLTVNNHINDVGLGGSGGFGMTDIPGEWAVLSYEVQWHSRRPLWCMIWGGVFERHPTLRFALIEQGAYWVPELLAQMDVHQLAAHGNTVQLSLKPSEYFHRQCYVNGLTGSLGGIATAETQNRHVIGVNNIMWGADYPHMEGTWPRSMEPMRETLAGVPPDEIAKMLGLNAARVYGFDVAKLTPIAEKVGPEF